MKKLVLIDGNSLLNRAFYATPVFTTSEGVPTNAIFGFIKLLFKIQSDVKPDYLVVAFDMKAPTFRHLEYDGYKASRKPMPEELAAQVEPLKGLLKAMKVAMCQKEGIEADDILGTLSKKFDAHSYIYTGDRDSYQLVDEKTDVFYTKRGVADLLKLNIGNFSELTELAAPSQIVDLKSLMGDSSDNIPGVPGIGEKTARELLKSFGSLDGVYEHVEELKGAVYKKLVLNKDMAYLSYKLATIDRTCELDIKLEDCAAPDKYGTDVKKLFRDLEFKSLLSLNIFESDASDEETTHAYPTKIKCSSFGEVAVVLEENSEYAVIAGDDYAEIYTGGKQYSLKAADDLISGNGVSFEELNDVMRKIFSSDKNKVISFDSKKLMRLLDENQILFNCDFEDLSLINYITDYERASLDAKELCAYFGYDYEYSAYALNNIFKAAYARAKTDNMLSIYEEIEKPLVKVLFSMEKEGVKVSDKVLNALLKHFHELSDEYRWKIYEACGKEFNLNSPMQLGDVLYNMGVTEVKKKNTGKYSTGADVLEKIADKYPVIADILKYRFYQKITSTYLEGFRPLIDKRNGLIHTTYNQTVTTTGRLSSANPNLQNIPIRDDEGRELRKLFVAREGNVFIDADYSQIELRLLAHFSGCKELIEAYRSGTDIHSVTASQVFGVPLQDVTAKMRRAAKAVNFGIIYGISDFGLAKNLNIPTATAKEYIEKYFATYSAVKDYMNSNVEFAREKGYVCTLTGRKRMIPEIKAANFNLRQFGERAAMNMPLQGSSADIIKIAMVNVYNALKKENLSAKLILQVHDELVIEAPESEASRVAEILKDCMENAVELSVPLTVEVHTGKDWYDAK